MHTLHGDEKTGAAIILRALEEPLRQIADNAGVDGSVVVEKVKNSEKGKGYDALKDEYVTCLRQELSILRKVTRSALQNAASVAAMVLTTESAVAEKPEKKKNPPMPAGDMDY